MIEESGVDHELDSHWLITDLTMINWSSNYSIISYILLNMYT